MRRGTVVACDPDLFRVETTHLRLCLRVSGQSEYSRHYSEDRCDIAFSLRFVLYLPNLEILGPWR